MCISNVNLIIYNLYFIRFKLFLILVTIGIISLVSSDNWNSNVPHDFSILDFYIFFGGVLTPKCIQWFSYTNFWM